MTELTGADFERVIAATPYDDFEGADADQRITVRLAMLCRGEDLLDTARVDAVLDMDIEDYLDYIGPVLRQRRPRYPVRENGDRTLVLSLPRWDVVIRPLKGREAHLLWGVSHLPRMMAMTSLSEAELRDLPYGEYVQVEAACAPLVQSALTAAAGGIL